ncbi:MAG TPA: hypothetical protein VK034_24320 [Enhygromyxa sp.]|nr:hypothetical protein [Enhygromyxa sp.]
MTGRAPLRLLPAPEDREPEPERGSSTDGGRVLAPGAPRSPGPVPLELARELRTGEPVVWWGSKDRIDRKPILWMLLGGALLLGFATLLAPELWAVPLRELWKPLIPALAPAALLLVRELVSVRTVLVTDSSLLVLDHRGRLDRLAFRNVRRVRRDLLTGGVLLEGAEHKLRVPPQLAEDARLAIASQTRYTVAGGPRPDDPLGYLG